MKPVILAGIVLICGEHDPGRRRRRRRRHRVPDADDAVLVRRVRLGQGGLIFTVIPASGDSPDEEERPVKMTTEVRVRKRGRDLPR
jgi:hypothetical protein